MLIKTPFVSDLWLFPNCPHPGPTPKEMGATRQKQCNCSFLLPALCLTCLSGGFVYCRKPFELLFNCQSIIIPNMSDNHLIIL